MTCDCEKAKERIGKLRIEWILVVLEIVLSVWTYYVYVWLICIQTTQHWLETGILLSVYHLLLLMGLWSYLRTLFTPRRPVPKEFRFDAETWQKVELDSGLQQETRNLLGVKTTTSSRGPVYTLNYCYPCGNIKPDRCHHCSRCRACVLRMDHHCPWVNRCVGFHNHKYFILFLHYLLTYSVFLTITCAGVLPRVWRRDFVPKTGGGAEKVNWTPHTTSTTRGGPLSKNLVIPTTIAVSVSASTSSSAMTAATPTTTGTGASLIAGTGVSSAFLQILGVVLLYTLVIVSLTPLLHMHARLLDGNITTLEWSRPLGLPGGSFTSKTFDLGSVSANHTEIMGPQRLLWLFPVFTSLGDGAHFPVWDARAGRLIDEHCDRNPG